MLTFTDAVPDAERVNGILYNQFFVSEVGVPSTALIALITLDEIFKDPLSKEEEDEAVLEEEETSEEDSVDEE